LDDATLVAKFGQMTADELVFLRAKISIARFFPQEMQQLLNFIGETFASRIENGKVIGDMADVFGKPVDEAKVFAIAQQLIAQQ